MTDIELKKTIGGASSTSGNFISAMVKLFTAFLEMGRNVGSALNYALHKKVCK